MEIKQPAELSHVLTMTHRNLLKMWHNPDNVSDVVIQPIIFTLLFGYLFGGAIAGSVQAYLPMLVTGILIQSILNAASGSGQQLREDINAGVFDRFKTLPISPIVPLALVGLMVKNAALIGSLSMIIILVLTFLSNAFIPTKTLPHLLQTIVRLNPVSLTITAMRTILRTGHWGPDAFGVLLSGFLIIVIFMPLTVLAYRRFG